MISCIAIEDEPLALKQLEGYIAKTPFLELKGCFQNAFEAVEIINNEKIDVLFLDINMPDINGIDFLKSLTAKPHVIFTTAYEEFALEGFKLDAIDYLLKPFSYSDFLKACLKAQKWLEPQKTESNDDSSFLFVKSEYRLIKIAVDDITYIEGMKEYIRIFLRNAKPIMTLMSMKKMEERLPSDTFMRIHKSYIVNLNDIKIVDKMRIIFDDNSYIPVSEQYKENFQNYLKKHQ